MPLGKETIRAAKSKARDSMPEGEMRRKSSLIAKRLLSMEEVKKSRLICSYVSKGSEAGTRTLIKKLLKESKKVLVPVVENDTLKVSEIKDIKELKKGAFGIPEPRKEFLRFAEPSHIDAILVPGIAFDRRGRRVGYGKGYYDRLLKKLKNATKIALAYEFQIIKTIPAEKHDTSVDFIVTEKNVIRCDNGMQNYKRH